MTQLAAVADGRKAVPLYPGTVGLELPGATADGTTYFPRPTP